MIKQTVNAQNGLTEKQKRIYNIQL